MSPQGRRRGDTGAIREEECKRCQKSKRLDNHKMICIHSEREQKFKCDPCGNMFLELKYLREHTHYKYGGKIYQYHKCAHLFAHRKIYNEHKSRCSK